MSKARLLAALARAVRLPIWLLLRLVPARRHAVVHGWPDGEANAVEVVRALRRRYPGPVHWLLDDPAYAGPAFARDELADAGRVLRVRKASLRALLLSLSAEVTLFTHGLFTAVTPPSNRLVVNLWHGDGPKATSNPDLVRSTVVVAQTRLWGDYKARLFGLCPDALAVVGNPRTDQFAEPLPAEVLSRLGLVEGRRRVLWLPTYREGRGPRERSMRDAEQLTASAEVRGLMDALAASAERLGLDLVVKPHPLDVDHYGGLAVRVLRNADLDAAGASLYQLLGACDALISDVSSAWVDYLVLDRPVGFYVPDLAEMQRRRGFNVDDFGALAPGPRLESADDARTFLERVAAGTAPRPSEHPGYDRIGPVRALGATDRLLDWLDAFQARRGRRRLFSSEVTSDV
ncbi:MAG: CDP-glycerol glycerophosphotransferase family protein [Actinomycetota bacterium]|nr:CDP-glycerol glycerophosphotransferase family protein [Actinomycetota bacterium]